MSELKPCPFCGATDSRLVQAFTRATDDFAYWSVECLDCGVEVADDESQEAADRAWNRRTLPAAASVEAGERECQAAWRCAIGDAVGAIDVLKNQWVNSRKKAEREAAAVLNQVASLIWAAREPAATNYNDAAKLGKALIERVREALTAKGKDQAEQFAENAKKPIKEATDGE